MCNLILTVVCLILLAGAVVVGWINLTDALADRAERKALAHGRALRRQLGYDV